jgi:ABC-type sugar transport system ATPase subunit
MLQHAGLPRDYEATGISKAFSGVPVLRGVDVTFRSGEIHTIVGENGAGKSTLLKIMAGVYSADAGNLSIDGHDLDGLSPASARRKGIYLVPQEPRLMPDLSVAENLYLGSLPRGRFGVNVDWRRMNGSTRELLERVGLDAAPRTLAGQLPLAHQQLLECARALALGCEVIFFDEPTSPLTSHEADKLFALMDDLRTQGMVLGFISHRFDEVEQVSDRITVLRDGVITARYARGEATRANLINDMVGRELTMTKRVTRPAKTGPAVLDIQSLVSEPEVKDISIQVRAGEIVGLGGLVGSGRTELSEAAFGLRPFSAGRVLVGDKDVTGFAPRACIDAGLIYLCEDRGRNGIFADVELTRNASAAIIPHLPTRWRLIKPLEERRATQTALQNAGVKAASMDLPIKSLSGGNQQKVLLARWMMADPTVAIFDEPTRGVDVGAKEGIYETIETFAENGLATLVISSELEELVRLCDRVYAVYEGRIVGELIGDDITTEAVGSLAVGAA